MRRLAILAAAPFFACAQPSTWTYVVQFSSEAAAMADPIVGTYNPTQTAVTGWKTYVVDPNVLMWNSTQDQACVPPATGCVVHVPVDSNWRAMITLSARSTALEAEEVTAAAGGGVVLLINNAVGPSALGLVYNGYGSIGALANLRVQPKWQGGLSWPNGL